MKVDSPLSKEFLLCHPLEAARALELVSAEHVAALFNDLAAEIVSPVLASMLPNMAAGCLTRMEAPTAAKLVTEMPVTHAARIYRLLQPAKQEELSSHLSDKTQRRLRRSLDYSSLSAGDLMDPNVIMLPDDLTVADAIRRIERHSHAVSCEIYVVDSSHHLLGVIDLGKLLTSSHPVRLRDIMTRTVRLVPAHASAENLLSHPGWATRRKLPVVERDNTLVGVLDYMRMQEATGESAVGNHDPSQNLLSLVSLYWLSMIKLLDSLLSTAGTNKGEQR